MQNPWSQAHFGDFGAAGRLPQVEPSTQPVHKNSADSRANAIAPEVHEAIEPTELSFALGDSAWEAILGAVAALREQLSEDASLLAAGAAVPETSIASLMPRRFWPRYDAAFAGRMEGTAASLLNRLQEARRIGWAYPYETLLNSVADELLMAQAVRLAIETAEPPEVAEELELLEELSFEDRDFELLYDLTNDGITDDQQLSDQLGFANLSFYDWFKPFR